MNIDPEINESTVYVGGLAESMKYEELYNLFVTFGVIKSIDIPMDYQTKKHRGYAFIEYEEKEDAESAIDNYDESEIFGKIVRVKKAKPIRQMRHNRAIWHDENWQKENMERIAKENDGLLAQMDENK